MMNADEQTFLTQTGFTGISTQTSGTTSQERKPKSPESIQSAGNQRYQEAKTSTGDESSVIPAGDRSLWHR
jgi:hypothetical protein